MKFTETLITFFMGPANQVVSKEDPLPMVRPTRPPPKNPSMNTSGPTISPMRAYLDEETIARENNPAVKDAWEKYQIVLTLAIGPAPKQTSRGRSGRSAN